MNAKGRGQELHQEIPWGEMAKGCGLRRTCIFQETGRKKEKGGQEKHHGEKEQ